MVSNWNKQLLIGGPEIFKTKTNRHEQVQAAKEDELYEQIGRPKMELEWLNRKLPSSVEVKRTTIESGHPTLSMRPMRTDDLNRSTYYWWLVGESPLNLRLMRLIDEEYIKAPFYGNRKTAVWLNNQHGHRVNHKRMARLMQKMGLQSAFPRPRTSVANKQYKEYPCLLRGLAINWMNQVWAADITRAYASRLHVPGNRHGLVQPLCARLAAVQYA